MKKTRCIVCSVSTGLDDMKREDQSNPVKVLHALVRSGRFSVFEATANDTIARMMTRLYHKALIYEGKKYGGPMLNMDESESYPWTKVVLTDASRQLLADYPETPGITA